MEGITSKTKKWNELSLSEKQLYRSFTSKSSEFKSPFYQYSFVESVAQVNPHVYVLILYRQEKPFLFFPYQYRGKLDKMVGLAERIGSNMSDVFGPVLEPGSFISIEQINKNINFSLLNFDHLPVLLSSFKVPFFSKQLASQILVNKGAEYYFDWLKTSNKKFYNDTKRRKRKAIEALGPLDFKFNNESSFELERLITQKRAQYARTNVKDSLKDDWKLKLLEELAHQKDDTFQPVLSTLYCGNTWLASHLGIKANGILQYWLPVYEIEYRSFAPGRLLLFETISALKENNLTIIDRGEGISDAKKDTANYIYQMGKGSVSKVSTGLVLSKLLQKYYWKK